MKNYLKQIIVLIFFFVLIYNVSYSKDANSIIEEHHNSTGQQLIKNSIGWKITGILNITNIPHRFVFYYAPPMQYKLAIEVRGMAHLMVYNGEEGWFTFMGIKDSIPYNDLLMLNILSSSVNSIFQQENYSEDEINYIGDKKIDDTSYYELKLNFGSFNDERAYINKENNLLYKYTTIIPYSSDRVPGEVILRDYHEVNGMMLPTEIEMNVNGPYKIFERLKYEPDYYLTNLDFREP